MKKVLLLALLCFSIQYTYAQFNQGYFATTASEYIITPSEGKTSMKTADGNILYVADYHKSGFSMLYAMKTDSNGNILWKFDYDINAFFNPYSVTQLTGGNFVISGIVTGGGTGGSLPNGNYAFYVCINNSGTLQWAKYFSTSAVPGTNPSVATSDGGFAGTFRPLSTSYSTLVKYDASGNVQWANTYNVGNFQNPSGIVQTSDGGYAISGDLQGPDGYFLMKFNSSGTLSWSSKIANFTNTQGARSLMQTSSGNYIISGKYMGTAVPAVSVCINSSGTSVLWALQGCSIVSETTGGFIAYSYQTDNSTYVESYLYKINSSGSSTPVWAKSYPMAQASNVIQYASSTFIMSGTTDYPLTYSWSTSYPLGLYCAKTYNGINCGTGNHAQALTSVSGLTCSALSLSATAATLSPTTLSLTTYTLATTTISKCTCPADAGPNVNDYNSSTGFCTGVQIGTASSGYTYQWNPTSDLTCSNCAQPTCTYSNTSTPQNYTLTVTGASCLKALSSVKVTTLLASLTASVTATSAISGNNITANGTYTANFTPSYYFWSLTQCDQYGNVISSGLTYNSGYIAGLPTGTYTFTGTNSWPCDTYYIVWFWVGNNCGGQWVSAPLVHITLDPNFSLTSAQINPTTYTVSATYPTDNPTTSPGFGYWWDVVQIDPGTGNPISGTEINNASCWWTYPTALKFNGYNGTSTLGSCSNVGNFTAMDYYKISFGVWSNACPWISLSRQLALCGLACRTEENPDGVLISELSGVEAGSTGTPSIKDQPEKLSVYPNPTAGTFKLITGHYTSQLVQVYDLNGKEVFSQTIDGPATINLTHLPEGIYNVQVTENNNRMNTRVIITH